MLNEAVLLVNGRSRKGRALFRSAAECFKASGVRLAQARCFGDPQGLSRACQAELARGAPLIAIGGGDGTLSLVAKHFVGSDSVLGVLPLGTGNALARDLRIPSSISGACDVILNGKTARVDLGQANDDFFVNVATVGLTTRIARELTDEAKKRFGRAAYLFAFCRALARVRPFRAKLITPDQALEFDTLQVVIGNGRYHAGPLPIAPDASITEGRLSVYALATCSRSAFFRLAWKLPTGSHVNLPEVHAFSVVRGRVEATPPRHVTVDGEVSFETPLDFSVAPKALQVRVPASFGG